MLLSSQPSSPGLSDAVVAQLRRAFAASDCGRGDDVELAMGAICSEAHARKLPAEALVFAVRTAWRNIEPPPGVTTDEWSRGYYLAVGRCLAAFFGEKP